MVQRAHNPLAACLAVITVISLPAALAAQTPDLYDENKVRTYELTFATSNWLNTLKSNKSQEINIPADLKIDGTVYKKVGVRARGITSYNWGVGQGKLPLRITMDAYTAGGNIYGYKSLILNNGFADPTWCREVIAYKIMATRVPAPRICYIKLIVNKANYGVYTSVESPNRDFISKHFKESNGNRYQGRGPFSYTYLSRGQLANYLPLKSSRLPTSDTDLYTMHQVLQSSKANRESKLPDLLDVDECLRYVAVDTVIGNYDGVLVHNYYLYNDPRHGRFNAIPWDLNYAFRKSGAVPFRFYYVAKLVEPTAWSRRYYTHVRSLTHEFCDWKVIAAMVARYQKLISSEVKTDPRGYGFAAFTANITQTSSGLPGLKTIVDTLRVNLLNRDKGFGTPPVISSHNRALQTSTQPTWVSAIVTGNPTKATLHYRVRGRYLDVTMFDDGKHGDGISKDGRWGGAIPIQAGGTPIEYYLSADTTGAESLLPRAGAFTPYRYRIAAEGNGVIINEVVVKNVTGVKDNSGEREDWIEVYNSTKSTVNIGGMYLSDNYTKPTMWKIPSGLSLIPGQRLVFWADDDTGQGPLHASFKLADGESVFLYDKDGKTLRDFVDLVDLDADQSVGCLEDGSKTRVVFLDPSPLSSNRLTTCGSRRFDAIERSRHLLKVSVKGTPKIGTTPTVTFTGAPANSPYLAMLSSAPGHTWLNHYGLTFLISTPILAEFFVPGTASGTSVLPVKIPQDTTLDGFRLTLQAFALKNSQIVASNGVEVQVCK